VGKGRRVNRGPDKIEFKISEYCRVNQDPDVILTVSGLLAVIEIKGLNQPDEFMFLFFLLLMFSLIFAQKDTMITKLQNC
jgi:hypothetical protein